MTATPPATTQVQVHNIPRQLPKGVVVLGDAEEDLGDIDGELQTLPEAFSSGKGRVIKIPHANKTHWSSTNYMCSRIYLRRQALLQYMVDAKDPPG